MKSQVLLIVAGVALAAPHIDKANGWLVVRARSEPGMVVAVTVRDAAVVPPLSLFDSFRRLSPRGTVIWAWTIGRGRPGFPPRSDWPPRLASFRAQHAFESQPAANIEQRTWVGSVRGWDLDMRVFFATQHPAARLLDSARAELRRLRLPP